MAITIISESYGPRKPLIECTADSLDELAALECAEGSTATVGGTEYTLDRVNGWIVPGSGGGGTGALVVRGELDGTVVSGTYTLDKTYSEIAQAMANGQPVVLLDDESGDYTAFVTYYAVSCAVGGNVHEVDFLSARDGSLDVWDFTLADENGYPYYEY